MKVDLDIKNRKTPETSLSFEGYKFTKSNEGFNEVEFNYPYDPNKDKLYLEVYKVGQDPYQNFYTTGRAQTKDGKSRIELAKYNNKIDMSKTFGIGDNQAFAYHYVLEDINGKGFPRVTVDVGDRIDNRKEENQYRDIFNIVTPNRSRLSRGGSMKLVIVDSQHVGWVYNDKNEPIFDKEVYNRARKGIKTITNKFGGTLAGLEHALDTGEYDKYSRIISLPLFTDDDFSAHAYWNKNCLQMASSLGNINNYASFQRKMFAHGLNFVSDGAFVNEGLEGIHFKHMLKWGEDSPFYSWFRASSIKDGPLSLGVFSKNHDFISHKVVNSPYKYTQENNGHIAINRNEKYDKSKPTYIQFYDKRLVTKEEKNDTQHLIKTYSKMSTDNVYEMHSHNDQIFPYAFEIDPEIYNKNIKTLDEYNKHGQDEIILLDSYKAAKLLSKNEYFVADGKFESGFETWDANPDIAKLNFVFSNTDVLALKNLHPDDREIEKQRILRGNYQVQDYVIQSGKYWTQKTDDILRLYIAQNLKNIDPLNPNITYSNIQHLSNNKVFPKSVKVEVSKDEVENVLSGFYNHKRKLNSGDKKSQILQGLMEMPLDSCELGDNIVSVLASPLISKRAMTKDEIGLSRYEIFKNGNKNVPDEYLKTYNIMDKIYTEEMYNFAQEILAKVDKNMPENSKIFDGEKVTEYGKYVLPLLTSEIAKYALIKSLVPKAVVNVDENSGEISYDYNKLKDTHLQSLGITNPSSPEDEARMLLSAMKKGMKKLDSSNQSELVKGLTKSLKGTSAESFQLADLIIDKTQTGLDWRIDATKDIADVESLRNKNSNFEQTWQTITDFWKKFTESVLEINPNSYIVAEITNKEELYGAGYGKDSQKYKSVENDVTQKFFRETGITSMAEYAFWFRDTTKLFGTDFEDGKKFEDLSYAQKIIFEKMMHFVDMGSLDSIRYAYTFIGNHDKPRALHCLAMNMELFYCDLNDKDKPYSKNYRELAYRTINDKFLEPVSDKEVEDYDFSAVSPKAIAMADVIRPAMIDVLNNYRKVFPNELGSQEEFNKAFIPISKAVSDLAQGNFKDQKFDPDAFGKKPIDVAISMVLKQAKTKYGFKLPEHLNKKFEDDVFETIMVPAYTKLLGAMKILVALPGMPTLFDGDDVGTTGYDTKSKNMFVQCRQRNHDEWLKEGSPKFKSFVKKYSDLINETMEIRTNPKCNALNNGAIYTLPQNTAQTGEQVSSIFRLSTDGRAAISIFNPTGLHYNYRANYSQNNICVDRLYFDEQGDARKIGIPGFQEGRKFVNANNEHDVYYTRVDNGRYYLTRHVNGRDVPIVLDDTALILYHVPEGGVPLTFTGSCLVKPSSKFVVNAYSTKNTTSQGKTLAFIK